MYIDNGYSNYGNVDSLLMVMFLSCAHAQSCLVTELAYVYATCHCNVINVFKGLKIYAILSAGEHLMTGKPLI